MTEILRGFAAVILAFGCFISLASCGGNKVAENVSKTDTPMPTETSEVSSDVGEVPLQNLPDNSTQERIDWVINEGNGRVYNMFLDNDGTVRWIYDNTPNPRLTQQVANFMAENSSLAGLTDYVLSLGISPNPYVANAEDDGVGGASDPGYSDVEEPAVLDGQGNLQDAEAWYADTFARMDESYANRDSHEQVVFSQQWDGSVVAEQRTSYDNMEVVQVEPCDYYTLTDNTWYWATYTDEYGYTWVSWVWPIRHDDGYLHAYYNFINGTPMVTWGNQVVKSFLVDDMSRRTPAMAQTDDSIIIGLDDFTVMFRGHRINANKVPADTSVTVSRDEMHACPQFNSETTADELYEYTVNEIIPNL